MKILFIHQNFPGQFKHLAPALAAIKGNEVCALTPNEKSPESWGDVKLLPYKIKRKSTPQVHPWVIDFETKVIRAEAVFHAGIALKEQGYSPDVIVAHHGWGESLFVKDVWPDAALGIFCEFFYPDAGGESGFDTEFSKPAPGDVCRLHIKNANNVLHFEVADAGISPTPWQASTFPAKFSDKISVIHDGIDTNVARPNSIVKVAVNGEVKLTKNDEVITFVNRNLEPYRGYHIFMRALPELLRSRPKANVVIVGEGGLGYGGASPSGESWKDIFINEVRGDIPDKDWARVHFTGRIPYEAFIALLQISTAHVYLTYPFVLSWSLLEAMSCGCAIVASNTKPLEDIIIHNKTGLLVDFFDSKDLVRQVCKLLENPKETLSLRKHARQFVMENYDLKTICLPKQLAWVENLAAKRKKLI
jgi:glycosyltransferase involved in cell wall biosynthesis